MPQRDSQKKREKTQRTADIFERTKPVTLIFSRFCASFRGDYPSPFDIPCSAFFGSRGGWRNRLVDGFAAQSVYVSMRMNNLLAGKLVDSCPGTCGGLSRRLFRAAAEQQQTFLL
jgi:hypothetical protein